LGATLGTNFLDNSWNNHVFYILAWLSFVLALLLLPTQAQKNAVLAGTGNAFCLFPWLNLLFYNSLTEKIVGWGWIGMGVPFPWPLFLLSFIGLLFINIWWVKRSHASRHKVSSMLGLAGVLILLLALAPSCGELVGNLSLRELYTMPTAPDLPLPGNARDLFLTQKFSAVLIDCELLIIHLLPFVLGLATGAGILLIQLSTRTRKTKTPPGQKAFPASDDLPWAMTLLTSGIFWLLGHSWEPAVSNRIRQAGQSIAAAPRDQGGFEITVLFSAALFLICAYELTRRLKGASRIRPFYASLLVLIEIGTLAGLLPFPLLGRVDGASAQPIWLGRMLALILTVILCFQIRFIIQKIRNHASEWSIWNYDGRTLMSSGLSLGIILACSGLTLFLTAMVIASTSATLIHALVTWGTSIEKSTSFSFDLRPSESSGDFFFWKFNSLYCCICLATGLSLTLVLSALEFIRFNSFRYYKARRASQPAPASLVLNE